MEFYDFEFDSLRLSDKGYILCHFDSTGVETYPNGSEITFTTVPTRNGQKHELVSSEYSDALTATFQICKNLCVQNIEEISVDEMRDIMRWLNRKTFHRLRFINDEYINIWFEGSFNVSRIEIEGRLVGFELECFTNRPHGFHEPVTINIKNLQAGELRTIYSKSDEEGSLYPDLLEITIEKDGTFEMYNSMEPDRVMQILNCKQGEVITINYPLISSTVEDRRDEDGNKTKLQNDFNFVFFRIATQFKNRLNNISTSLPCSMVIKYTPIVKVGM